MGVPSTAWWQQTIEWIWNTLLKPVAELFGKVFRWWQALIAGVLVALNHWLQEAHNLLASFRDQLHGVAQMMPKLPDLSFAMDLLAKVNVWVPLQEFVGVLSTVFVIWGILTAIRLMKNWLLENGW